MSEIPDFYKCKRDAKLLLSSELKKWRLASVDEVLKKENLAKIKAKGILKSWDTARLLNGCVRGKYRAVKQYMPDLEDMLLIETKESRPPDDSFSEKMYFKDKTTPKGDVEFPEVKWTTKGAKAAILFSTEDKITEPICFVLDGIVRKSDNHGKRVEEYKKLMECLEENFHNGRTVLHYAVDQSHNKKHGVYVTTCLKDNFQDGIDLIRAADIYGRTALHIAAFHGNIELCRILIEECQITADETDINRENSLHFALKGKQNESFEYLCKLSEVESVISSRDAQGRTYLHEAAAQGSKEIITTLLASISKSKDKESEGRLEPNFLEQSEGRLEKEQKIRRIFIRQPDLFGQTALLEAARGGHVDAVELLLKEGSRPLHERNSDGRSALHYAVQLSKKYDARKMAWLLLENCESDKQRSLLLWASAMGSGTAEEASPKSSQVRKYLKEEKERLAQSSKDLLSSAIELQDEKMAWELVTRCADTTRTEQMAKCSCCCEKQKCAKNVIGQLDRIEKMPEQGRDQPAICDSLGRKEFAEGLAALFLNPYVKPPITVGISGDWGMGKSSLMIQTEAILLKTAAQLAFPGLLETEQFPGCRQIQQTSEGRRKFEELNIAMKHSSHFKPCAYEKDYPLLQFLNADYKEEHRDVYKSLAVMDRGKMFETKAVDSHSNEYPIGKIPSILTIRYNAWHYQNQSEAWAGLAVETTKAIEESMTTAQRVRCHYRYAWRKQRNTIWMELFLPCLLALFLSGWLAWVLWKIFSESKNNELVQLTYGSIPISILVVVWTVMRQFLSVIKPVSAQIMGYFSKLDHTTKLGYQHQVISDIKFLMEEIGEKPSPKWKFLGWLCNLVNIYPDYSDKIKGTSISKSPGPGKDDIRMIVFVDDLDRCEETVILKVLSAVNLVLADCNINVILGMDEKMITKAMKHQFPDSKEDAEELKELTKKYLSKIVQLPLCLPDTSEDETKKFLHGQLGEAFRSRSQIAEAKVTGQASTEESDCDKQSLAGHSRAHVCLEVHDIATPNSTNFFSRLSQMVLMLKNCLPRDPETKKERLGKMKLVTMALNFQRLMTNYSEEEGQALDDLSEAATGERRLPREWKRFLIYHRVAWNILSQSEKVKKTPGWQMQLVVWLFCCWQWEHQINDVIKDWKKLVPVNGFFDDGNDSLESTKPSLKCLIEYHRPRPEREGKGGDEETEEDTESIKTEKVKNEENKRKGGKDENKEKDRQNKGNDKEKNKGNDKEKNENDKKEEEKEEKRKNWYSLKKMLDTHRDKTYTYDVSLDCILSFQKFRLHCIVGHLPSPKTSGNKKD